MIKKTVKWMVELKCRKHPRFDGLNPGEIKGGCKECLALVEARAQLRAIHEQVENEINKLMAKAEAAGCYTPGLVTVGNNAPST